MGATAELGCAPLASGREVPLSLHVSFLIVFILSSEVNADIVSLYNYILHEAAFTIRSKGNVSVAE